MSYRIFVAHSKNMEDAAIDQLCVEVRSAAQVKNPGIEIEVTSGRDDFKANAMGAGGWNAWGKRVATGVNAVSNEPYYNAIVIPYDNGGIVGRATAQIAFDAHHAGKSVRAFEKGQFLVVDGLEELNPKDFKAGWKLAVVR